MSPHGGHFVTCPPLSTVVLLVAESPRVTAPDEHPPKEHAPRQASGAARGLYVLAGLLSVGMAYLGVILPGLPATPWVLLASFCFSKSSPRLERWLRRSPLFGPMLRDWIDHKGIRRPVKVFAVALVIVVVSLTLTFGPLPLWAKCVTGTLAAVGVCTVLFAVPTVTRS